MEADIASPCHQARLTLATLGQDRIDQPRVKARDLVRPPGANRPGNVRTQGIRMSAVQRYPLEVASSAWERMMATAGLQ
jgi:hypothetical protein